MPQIGTVAGGISKKYSGEQPEFRQHKGSK